MGVGPAGGGVSGLRVGPQLRRRPGARLPAGVVLLRRLPGRRLPPHDARGLAPRPQEDAPRVPGVHVRRRRARHLRAQRLGVRRPTPAVRLLQVHGGHVHAGAVHGARREEVSPHGQRGGVLRLRPRVLVPPGARLRVPRRVMAEHVLLDVRALSLLLRPALLPSPGVATVAAGARPEAGRHGGAEADHLAQRQLRNGQLLPAGPVHRARGRRRREQRGRRLRHAAGDVGAAVGVPEAGRDHGGQLRRGDVLLWHAAQRRQPGIRPLPERHAQRAGRAGGGRPHVAPRQPERQAERGDRAHRGGGGVQPRVRGHPAARRVGADGRRGAVLLRGVHGVRRPADLLHRDVPDVRAQLGGGAGAADDGAGRRGGARAHRAGPREQPLVVRRVRDRHRLLRPLHPVSTGDEGKTHVGHHGRGGAQRGRHGPCLVPKILQNRNSSTFVCI